MKRIEKIEGIADLIRDLSIIVRKADLGSKYNALTTKFNEGYLVVVNENLDYEKTIDALKHELCHIMIGHLDEECKTERQMEREVQIQMRKNKYRI
ncbi:MAG: ImmA/IrrE family metallo-endopeptidase [Mobilitalea sp.]